MSKDKGWIKLYRSVEDNWVWNEKPFDRKSAWIDLLLMVNHEERTVAIGNQLVTVKPGQKWTSLTKLADRWGWSIKKTRNFLNMLQSDGMVYVHSSPKGTLVTIVNYLKYQGSGRNRGTQEEQQKKNERKVGEKHGKNEVPTNKNVKNDKNDKECKEEAAAPLVHVPGQSYNMGLDYDPWGTKK